MHHLLRPFLPSTSQNADMQSANEKRAALQPRLTAGATAVEHAAHQLSDSLLVVGKRGVSDAYDAERAIETELTEIERLLATNATQADLWTALLDKLNLQLMEMGDVANWVDTLHASTQQVDQLCQQLSMSSLSSTSPSPSPSAVAKQ